MKTIHKYAFDIKDVLLIDMHDDAKVLSIGVQNGQPCIWTLEDTSKLIITRSFRIFGTGHNVPDEWAAHHIATFQMHPFVWHVFG